MWHIQIRHSNPFQSDGFFVTERALDVAKWTSLGNPGLEVSASAFGRIRVVYKDGQLVSDFPSLKKFYSNVSGPSLEACWERGGRLSAELTFSQ